MARFDLYSGRKSWWWVFFLSVAVAKNKPHNQEALFEMLLDAIEYQESYDDSIIRKGILSKYDIKGTTK